MSHIPNEMSLVGIVQNSKYIHVRKGGASSRLFTPLTKSNLFSERILRQNKRPNNNDAFYIIITIIIIIIIIIIMFYQQFIANK